MTELDYFVTVSSTITEINLATGVTTKKEISRGQISNLLESSEADKTIEQIIRYLLDNADPSEAAVKESIRRTMVKEAALPPNVQSIELAYLVNGLVKDPTHQMNYKQGYAIVEDKTFPCHRGDITIVKTYKLGGQDQLPDLSKA